MQKKHLIIITGPTAVGKTDTAIRIARYFNTEIVYADSRQVYREMKIGTAAPTDEQIRQVKHHLVGHHSIHEPYNAGMFETEAISVLDRLFSKNDIVIMTGGSGMYIRAVCQGIDELPSTVTAVREKLKAEYGISGLAGIQEQLREADPVYFGMVDLNNPKRILKALEIYAMTGRPYSSFLTGEAKKRNFTVVMAVLNLPREELHRKINLRVDQMMTSGLEKEARELYPFRGLNALNTVGYKELFMYFENKFTLSEAIEKIKGHTRQYARRQLTWFRNQGNATWFAPLDEGPLIEYIEKRLNESGNN